MTVTYDNTTAGASDEDPLDDAATWFITLGAVTSGAVQIGVLKNGSLVAQSEVPQEIDQAMFGYYTVPISFPLTVATGDVISIGIKVFPLFAGSYSKRTAADVSISRASLIITEF